MTRQPRIMHRPNPATHVQYPLRGLAHIVPAVPVYWRKQQHHNWKRVQLIEYRPPAKTGGNGYLLIQTDRGGYVVEHDARGCLSISDLAKVTHMEVRL
jgi:hypothetical protein